jgi:hypothetical protein
MPNQPAGQLAPGNHAAPVPPAESIALDNDGSLLLIDKFGLLSRAVADASAPGGWALQPEPLMRIGAGRPLGFHLLGRQLYVCDTTSVGGRMGCCRLVGPQ